MFKKILDKLDKVIFSGKLKKFFKILFYEKFSLNYKKLDFNYNYYTQYNKNFISELIICVKNMEVIRVYQLVA